MLLRNSLASLVDSNPWKFRRALANTLRVLASSLLIITGYKETPKGVILCDEAGP